LFKRHPFTWFAPTSRKDERTYTGFPNRVSNGAQVDQAAILQGDFHFEVNLPTLMDLLGLS
jgi:hypothetical protein